MTISLIHYRYLKTVVSVHSNMRAVRVQRQLEQKQLARLEVRIFYSVWGRGEWDILSLLDKIHVKYTILQLKVYSKLK